LWLFELLSESAMHIAIFGAGHVGSACVAALSHLDCRIRWIDGRRNVFPDQLPARVTRIDSPSPAREVSAMPPGTCFLVMTHSHPLDYDICLEVLKRNDAAYCGLIGSKSKRQRFVKIVRDCGLPATRMNRLTCPIGVSGIRSKRPEEIAVAVVAQLLQLRDEGLSAHDRDRRQTTLSVVPLHSKSQ
jgi:xanthine dehydrogenase accessory factor